MITAAEARSKICGEEDLFEERAQVIADYLVDVVANDAVEKMVENRARKACVSYNLGEVYRPAMEQVGLGRLTPRTFGDEYDLVTKRAREIANAKLHEAGYSGAGFFEKQHGEPCYAGGHGIYYTVELEIEC